MSKTQVFENTDFEHRPALTLECLFYVISLILNIEKLLLESKICVVLKAPVLQEINISSASKSIAESQTMRALLYKTYKLMRI